MSKEKITIKQINEIQNLYRKDKKIGVYKREMREKAEELGLTHREILGISRDDFKLTPNKKLGEE